MASHVNNASQGFDKFGALGELLQIIHNHMEFMEKQEGNVDKFISKQSSADLLRNAKTKALETEKELLHQIMNISEMNTFLNNIILIENLFNASYTKQQKTIQETARTKFATNIEIYEQKPKPISDIDSFVELMFGISLHMTSFKKWLNKVEDGCKRRNVKIVSSSGARGKNIERAFYKSFYVYSVTHGDEGFKQMTDVLRCSLVFDSFNDLYQCFGVIEQLSKANNNGGILRCKDRFDPGKVIFGYRDILINMYCPGSKVVTEIQLHHTLFYKRKKISHTMYKKARLFEENEENMAYKYADEHIRKVIGDKIYEIQDGDENDDDYDEEKDEDEDDIFEEHECEMSAEALFEKWKLTKYTQSFIEDEGFDEPEIWVDITLNELKGDYGFKAGHAKKFIKFVQKLEKQRPEFEEIKRKRKKFKKKKTNERREDEPNRIETERLKTEHAEERKRNQTEKVKAQKEKEARKAQERKRIEAEKRFKQQQKKKKKEKQSQDTEEEKKELAIGLDSEIITNRKDLHMIKNVLVDQLMATDVQLQLLYRSTKDGDSAPNFHDKCDNKGPTLTLVHTEFNHIFGCYTSIPWTTEYGWGKGNAESTFLVLLRSSFGHETPKIYKIKKNSIKYAVHHHGKSGPWFGTGPDVQICNQFGSSHCKANQAYNINGNAFCGGAEYNDSTYQEFYFKYSCYEVFGVKSQVNVLDSKIITNKTERQSLDSKIITDKTEQQKLENVLVKQLKKQNLKLKLLYRAGVVNLPSEFHRTCDYKGATITIVHTEFNHVFGCYTSIPWTAPRSGQSGHAKQDSSAFIVLLRSSFGHSTPKIYNIQKSEHGGVEYAVWHQKGKRPAFGSGSVCLDTCGNSHCGKASFDIKGNELCGGKRYDGSIYYSNFDYKCY
eukprot:536322_1